MVKKTYTPKNKRNQDNPATELLADQINDQPKMLPMVSITFDKYQALCLVLLMVVGFLIYANTLSSPFVFDDLTAIKKNHTIRLTELSTKNLINAAFGFGKNRPVSMVSFAISYYFGGYNVLGYHLVNMFIHILNGILLFFLLKITLTLYSQQRFANPKLNPLTITSISFLSAFLWLVHPIQTQSVTYIVQRMNSMGAMFYLLALLLYVKGRLACREANQSLENHPVNDRNKKIAPNSVIWFFLCGLSGILALGSKESTALLPFFIFLYEWYFFQDLSKNWLKRQLKYIVAVTVLLSILAVIYLGLDPWEKFKTLRDFSQGQFTMGERLLTQTRVVIYYLSLLAYPNPSRLNLEHDFPLSYSLIDPFTTLPSILTIMGLIILGVCLARKQRLISFCIFWFLGNLVIESSVIPLAIIFEHRLYLPSMLVCLLPAYLMYTYIGSKWWSAGIICAGIALFSIWTFERNEVWRDEFTLWTDCVAKSPNKARPHVNLGAALNMRERTDEAIHHYLKALKINPNYSRAYHNLGAVYADQGQINKAIEHYLKCIQIEPNFPSAHSHLGLSLVEQGKINEAIEHYRKALQIEPNYAEAHFNLGDALAEQRKTNEAIEHYRKALQINPYLAEAHNNWGLILEKQGKFNEAAEHYRKAVRIKPELAEAQYNMGDALSRQGNANDAIEHYQKALQLKPEWAVVHTKLGHLLVTQGKYDVAVEHYHKALELKPDSAEAHFDLGDILVKRGKTDDAITHFKKALIIKPDYVEVHNNLGGELLKLGRIDEAQEHLNAALKLDPEIAQAHNNLGIILIQQGDVEQAIVHFKEALRIKPDFDLADANLKRALAIQKQMQFEGDAAKLETALKNKPDDPELYFEMGNLFLSQGDVSKAIDQFENALTIQPDYLPAINNLAMAYAADKQYDKALDAFKKMTALQPDNTSHYYNVAVLYALQTKVEESLEWLKKAVDKGYANWELIKTDKDLENIRNSAEYKELVKRH